MGLLRGVYLHLAVPVFSIIRINRAFHLEGLCRNILKELVILMDELNPEPNSI